MKHRSGSIMCNAQGRQRVSGFDNTAGMNSALCVLRAVLSKQLPSAEIHAYGCLVTMPTLYGGITDVICSVFSEKQMTAIAWKKLRSVSCKRGNDVPQAFLHEQLYRRA